MKKTLLTTMLLLTLSTGFVSAQQGTYTALEPLPCIPGNGIDCSAVGGAGKSQGTFDFQTYVQFMFNLVIALAAAASVFMIVFGGFQYMTTDAWTGKSESVSKIKNALLGLLLVLASYLILRTVDPRLVAIPATLVKPINTNYGSLADSHTNDFVNLVDQIGSDVATYNAGITSAQKNISDAKAALSQANQQKTSIAQQINDILVNEYGGSQMSADQIGYYCGFGSAGELKSGTEDLCKQLEQAQEQISSAQGAVNMNTAIGAMEASVAQCGIGAATFDPASNQKCLQNQSSSASVDGIYNNYGSQTGTTMSPDQQQALNAYYGYARNAVELNKQLSASVANQSASAIKTALDAMNANANLYAGLPGADQAVVQDMKRQQQQLNDLAKKQIPTSTNSTTPCMSLGC